ncbi:transcriptional regulator [bacterium]|nr:transcriptional regulator [bacterium]
MSKRSYNQFCALALALDVVGERWTLLIVRELMLGPKRFTDIQEGLPGIGTNLLSARLKELEGLGLIHRYKLPPPAASTVYELTEKGRTLEDVITALTQWGTWLLSNKFDDLGDGDFMFRAAWAVHGMRTFYDEKLAAELDETYEMHVGDEVLHVIVKHGNVDVELGPAQDPDVRVIMTQEAYIALVTNAETYEERMARADSRIEGDPEAARRFYDLYRPAMLLKSESDPNNLPCAG